MKDSKLLQLIHSLSTKESKQLSALVEVGFFNLKAPEKRILDYLLTKIAGSDLFSKKDLYNLAFPSAAYNDQKFRLCLSQLYKLVEKFVVINQIQLGENQHYSSLLLSRYFRKKELNKHYASNYKLLLKKVDYAFSIPFEVQLEDAFENYQFNSLQKRNQELNIQNLLDLTDHAFYSNKLRFVCYALSHEAIYSTKYKLEHLTEILNSIKERKLFYNPRIGIYYFCYLMITNPDIDLHYQNYKLNLFENQHFFDYDEKRSLYFFALNQCIKKLNSGDLAFGKEGLEIYQNGIENKTLFINNHLSRFTYRNMAMMAIRINDFQLAEKLTDDYELHLRKEDRESAFYFNKALINYFKKDLDNALFNIMKADFKDHLINLAAKTLQAKIYFELQEDQLLESHLDRVEMYLIRNKVLGYHRKNYKNFIKYSKRLIRVSPYNKEQQARLKELIKNEEVLTEKKWLLEQL